MYDFKINNEYKRKDIYKIIGIPEDTKGGNWDTGYNLYKEDFFIFVNIDTAGRTGHDYRNKFDGDDLIWYAKNNTRLHQPQIQKFLNPPGKIYIFWRNDDKKPFTYGGTAKAIDFFDESPVKIIWSLNDHSSEIDNENISHIIEGATKQITVNKYERDPNARKICIEKYGAICQVCNFNFSDVFGKIGEGFIHVHHKKALHEIKEEYIVDPIIDLIPLCPNCHAMAHKRKPSFSVEELKSLRITNKTE